MIAGILNFIVEIPELLMALISLCLFRLAKQYMVPKRRAIGVMSGIFSGNMNKK